MSAKAMAETCSIVKALMTAVARITIRVGDSMDRDRPISLVEHLGQGIVATASALAVTTPTSTGAVAIITMGLEIPTVMAHAIMTRQNQAITKIIVGAGIVTKEAISVAVAEVTTTAMIATTTTEL